MAPSSPLQLTAPGGVRQSQPWPGERGARRALWGQAEMLGGISAPSSFAAPNHPPWQPKPSPLAAPATALCSPDHGPSQPPSIPSHGPIAVLSPSPALPWGRCPGRLPAVLAATAGPWAPAHPAGDVLLAPTRRLLAAAPAWGGQTSLGRRGPGPASLGDWGVGRAETHSPAYPCSARRTPGERGRDARGPG